jgi:alkanesulfonate monooxygenase SsuD/methylene tetrahydromethanopterin reductase-like flavin-dependent oxidoreductase (luciferase family)
MGAALATQATERITIATSALACFPRSPMTTGVAAWDLQQLSGERFRLGLGPLIAPIIKGKYSTDWVPPAPRMREYVQALHAIFDCWQNDVPSNTGLLYVTRFFNIVSSSRKLAFSCRS